jgi:hypothetical protein
VERPLKFAQLNSHRPMKKIVGANGSSYVKFARSCERCSFPKERGRGTGRNRKTETTFGRVEIVDLKIYLAKQTAVEK